MQLPLLNDSATRDKRHYASVAPKKSQNYLLSNGQQLNIVKGGIA
ncbi:MULTISPECIES: hypothetical protein [Nostocaceae]|nr:MULTISPECIES: hypothetical protein [Nostocaceae]